jgi:non-specific serine/threonine protein kinase
MATPWSQETLPVELTSFLGRQDDVARLGEALARERLVTIAGAGGIGKTRTAIRVARLAAPVWRDGVVFVDLAPLLPADSLETAIHQVLGGAQVAADPRQGLIERVAGQHLAIVLDNCEHVLDQAAAAVAAMLRACPNLHVLATSRRALGVPGEFVWRLPPLPLPSLADDLALKDLAANPAVALFVDRARRARPDFELAADSAQSVIQVCRALDGVPLAVELAAARLRMFSVGQLADRIHEQLPLLSGGSRVGPERQRTMRAAIAWSHDQLDEPERLLFRRLAVFSGGWTLEAAEGICAGDGIAADGVLDLLDSLVDCSLVTADADAAEARFRFLFPVLEFARAELLASDEAEDLGGRHCRWMAAFVARAEPNLVGPAEVFWGERLERDHDNLLAALAWAETHRTELEGGLRVAGNLLWFWIRQGRFWEGLKWSRRLLAVDSSAFPRARIGALLTASWFASVVDSLDDGNRYASEALSLARDSGDSLSLVHALRVHAHNSFNTGAFEEARAASLEALDLAERLPGLPLPIVEILVDLQAVEANLGNLDASDELLQRALDLAVAGGSRRQQALVLVTCGASYRLRGDFRRAEESSRDGLKRASDTGFVRLISWANFDLGLARVLTRDFAGARDSLCTALGQGLHRNERDLVAHSLLGLAALEAVSGDAARAARWLGAIEHGLGGLAVQAPDQPVLDLARDTAEQKLGPRFVIEMEAGRALDLMDTAREALALASPVPAPPAAAAPSVLSPRETEVLRLLVDGASNREIAERLVLSTRTVETHIANIYAKLGARSRVEAVRFAVEAGLITLTAPKTSSPAHGAASRS